MTGTYMRHRWISPLDIWESLTWRSKQRRIVGGPEENDKGEMRLAREAVGGGTDNPSIIATDALIRKEPIQDFEEQLNERECYGGQRLNRRIHPEYGMLGGGRIRKLFSEIWIGDMGVEVDLKELVNMFDRNQMGCRDKRCACGGDIGIREGGGNR